MTTKMGAYGKWLAVLPLIALAGCAGAALHHDYADYSQVYADSINRQLLLNLARLSRNEPAYFIQLGTISSQYQFTSSAGFQPLHSRVSHPNGAVTSAVQDTLTLGGSLGAGVTETPTFSFVPLNGEGFAEAILAPISDKTFLTFYDQGYQADLLARTMVASVAIKIKDASGKPAYKYYINNPYSPTYPEFLEYCDGLRNAQLNQTLTLAPNSKDPLTVYSDSKAALSEIVSAINAGLTVKYNADSKSYVVTTEKGRQGLRLGPNLAALPAAARTAEYTKAETFATGFGETEFKMRTFEAVMYSVAKEAVYFNELKDHPERRSSSNIEFVDNGDGAIAVVNRSSGAGAFAVRPVIRIKYNREVGRHFSKLVDIKYGKDTYLVGDLEGAESDIDTPFGHGASKVKVPATNNRSSFTLISYLFSQIAIDPQKLPVQQLIQVQ
jgi:hypothetical protein